MIVLHRSLRGRDCADRALVLTAMGIEHELERGLTGWRLCVAEHDAGRAREQLALWEQENRRPVPRVGGAGLWHGGAWAGVLGYALVLSVTFALQTGYEAGIDWAAAGAVEVARVRGGEWWRLLTALTLHADFPHLIGNLIFGGFFGLLLAREVGGGLAWLLILLAGAAGNLMNVAVQRPDHASLGASTAVFGALGVLAAYLWSGRHLLQDSWARRWAPIVGGLWLLAWLGTGDERTDVVAHLTGFVAGFGLGALLGRARSPRSSSPWSQAGLAAVALLAVVGAWALALADR